MEYKTQYHYFWDTAKDFCNTGIFSWRTYLFHDSESYYDFSNAEYAEIEDLFNTSNANVNLQDAAGSTALIHIISVPRSDLLNVIKILIDAGSDVNIKNNDGFTA